MNGISAIVTFLRGAEHPTIMTFATVFGRPGYLQLAG